MYQVRYFMMVKEKGFFVFLKVGPVFCFQTTLRRTYDDAFSEDDDDEWVFDPALDRVMVG